MFRIPCTQRIPRATTAGLALALGLLVPTISFAQSRVRHTLRWQAVPGAIGYLVQVRSPQGQVVVNERLAIPRATFTVAAGTHYFRIVALNKFGETGSATPWQALRGGQEAPDPAVLARRKKEREAKARAAKVEAKTAAAKREAKQRQIEQATGEFTLSGDAIVRGRIIESGKESIVVATEHGDLRLKRSDIVEARVGPPGKQKLVAPDRLHGVRSSKEQSRLTSGGQTPGKLVRKKYGLVILHSPKFGRIELRSEDISGEPAPQSEPPKTLPAPGQRGRFVLAGGATITGTVITAGEHHLVVRTRVGKIDLLRKELISAEQVSEKEQGWLTRFLRFLGIR